MSAPSLVNKIRKALAEIEWEAQKTIEPTSQKQAWINEGYRRGLMCAVADIEAVMPQRRGK